MANNAGFSFLMDDFGAWTPTVPQANAQQPPPNDWQWPEQTLPIDTENAFDPANVDYWLEDPGAAGQNWASVVLPFMQLLSNNQQFATEFDEAQQRFWQQFDWTQGRDQFQMDLASRQQSAEEQQAIWQQGNTDRQLTEQELNNLTSRNVARRQMNLAELQQEVEAGQWDMSFAAQQQNDEHARNIADQRLAFEQSQSDRQLSLEEQQAIWLNEYRTQQLANEQEAIASQERIARYNTFGRGSAPGRWTAQWG